MGLQNDPVQIAQVFPSCILCTGIIHYNFIRTLSSIQEQQLLDQNEWVSISELGVSINMFDVIRAVFA